ncbi:MAG: shikimate kinase [Acidimicrobiia bacterium]|nr:MAG: shikimate kinase [Acidimicrobiia bacterium]
MLWLVGLMGSGKSTIGPLAADLLGVAFVDTDALVETRTGQSISELFEAGEQSFRDVEAAVIEDVSAGPAAVVATGGGAVLREANQQHMRASGVVVWLRATAETLAARVGQADGRPLLAGAPAERLATLVDQRRADYAAAADVVIDTDGRGVEEVLEEVVAAWPAS